MASSTISNRVALGAGCFWGTEKFVRKGENLIEKMSHLLQELTVRSPNADFQKRFPDSIKTAEVGFMSPNEHPRVKNPTYRDVCTGRSGHGKLWLRIHCYRASFILAYHFSCRQTAVEVLLVELTDPQKHFEELVRFFFAFHDPTTKNRQGNDAGFQYASYIFCGDEEQSRIAQKVRGELQGFLNSNPRKQPFANKTVTTKIGSLMEFTKAEEEHQRYLELNPSGYW